MKTQKKKKVIREKSSFKDPSGYLFYKKGELFRKINFIHKPHYSFLMSSGLYKYLVGKGLLLRHTEIRKTKRAKTYKIIKPQIIPFISYPYEWCFSQLKDAALTTLEIQRISLEYGMTLKDASAYNIQFLKGKPVFIDTLSFEKFENLPWSAYRQYCQHFLVPLALAGYNDHRLLNLLNNNLDGISLDLASRLLPKRSYLNLRILMHIHLNARAKVLDRYKRGIRLKHRMSKDRLLGLLGDLQGCINNLTWDPEGTTWENYYSHSNYKKSSLNKKDYLVKNFLGFVKPKTVWDIGANTGRFSRIAAGLGAFTLAIDSDMGAVEKHYLAIKNSKLKRILPLLLDITNPSSGSGWGNEERKSFFERGRPDCILALALIHHLRVSGNVPLTLIAELFSANCNWLVIEFIPKTDSNFQKLLGQKKDIYEDYSASFFEQEFKKRFIIKSKEKIAGSERFMYLMKKK